MKKLLIIPMILSCLITNGQNLVPNPSFEDTVVCPFGLTQIAYATGWSSYRATPDYFNSCAANTVSVPQNARGFQNAFDGNAYAFIATFVGFPGNIREFMGVQLLQPLVSGVKYFLEARISRSDSPVTNGASNNFCFRFSNTAYSIGNPAPIDNFCHYRDTSIITDSIVWTKVLGSFIADSAYQYLIIGNFFDDSHTDTIDINGYDAAYYVDFICVSTDSLTCISPTGIKQLNSLENEITPNPVFDEMKIVNNSHYKIITIRDLFGQKIMTRPLEEGLNIVRVSSIAAGMYLVFLDDKFCKKIIVQH